MTSGPAVVPAPSNSPGNAPPAKLSKSTAKRLSHLLELTHTLGVNSGCDIRSLFCYNAFECE